MPQAGLHAEYDEKQSKRNYVAYPPVQPVIRNRRHSRPRLQRAAGIAVRAADLHQPVPRVINKLEPPVIREIARSIVRESVKTLIGRIDRKGFIRFLHAVAEVAVVVRVGNQRSDYRGLAGEQFGVTAPG